MSSMVVFPDIREAAHVMGQIIIGAETEVELADLAPALGKQPEELLVKVGKVTRRGMIAADEAGRLLLEHWGKDDEDLEAAWRRMLRCIAPMTEPREFHLTLTLPAYIGHLIEVHGGEWLAGIMHDVIEGESIREITDEDLFTAEDRHPGVILASLIDYDWGNGLMAAEALERYREARKGGAK
jgi:hypothetical protein